MDKAEKYIELANLKQVDERIMASHSEEFWTIVRSMAVLDWTLRTPEHALDHKLGEGMNVEFKFETIMRKVRQLAESVLEESTAKVQ